MPIAASTLKVDGFVTRHVREPPGELLARGEERLERTGDPGARLVMAADRHDELPGEVPRREHPSHGRVVADPERGLLGPDQRRVADDRMVECHLMPSA